jgi:hypothetical protein
MSPRTASLLAWSLWVLCLALAALALLLQYANNPSRLPEEFSYTVPFLAFVTVGALVVSRRPENPIGWIFCVVGLSNVIYAFALRYAVYTLVMRPGSLPGGEVAAWLATGWAATLGWGLMATFVPLLFPTGRLPSSRWRPVAWLAAALLVLESVALAVTPGPVAPSITNPLGIEDAAGVLGLITGVGVPLLMALMVASVTSLVLRFRRSEGEERQQLKWFAYSVALLATSIILGTILANFVPVPEIGFYGNPLQILGVASVPVATGVAILRYRLYDIDRIINRTLVYGALTVSLILVYVVGVVSLQAVFRALTGQGSQLAVVASTLAIAALFGPLRRGVQSFIDRRFYRGKYDAAKTLEAFSTRLRDEVELGALSDDLLGTVRGTVQPEHASLWLRPPVEARPRLEERG